MEEFERLCHDEYQTVRLFLVRLCGDAALAEELTQETFYQAMRGWKKFRGQCAASTWLCGIAKRQFFQYCRKPRPLPVEQLPEAAVTLPEPVPILLASERLDALVAAVYHLSRSASQQLICQGRVALNDREAQSANAVLRPGDSVSVRGKGRFIYEGIDASTRKGRLRVMVRIF